MLLSKRAFQEVFVVVFVGWGGREFAAALRLDVLVLFRDFWVNRLVAKLCC